jgi:hypothetical protein
MSNVNLEMPNEGLQPFIDDRLARWPVSGRMAPETRFGTGKKAKDPAWGKHGFQMNTPG